MLPGTAILFLILVISLIGLVVLFRGLFSFYCSLEVYHRTYGDYDPVIAVKGRDVDDVDGRAYVDEHDLKQSPSEEVFVPYSQSDPDDPDDCPPEIILDFEANKYECRGESLFTKFLKLWGYSSVTTALAAIIISLHAALFQQFDMEVIQRPAIVVVGVIIVLSVMHTAIRLASFLPIGFWDIEEQRERLRSDLHNFAFSFIMSSAVLSAMWVFVFYLSGGTLNERLFIDESAILVLGTTIVVPMVLAAISELILWRAPITGTLMSDEVYRSAEIDPEDT